MNLVQVSLAYWLRHELLDAIPKSAVNDQVGTRARGTLAFERRPFSQRCWSVKVDSIRVVHVVGVPLSRRLEMAVTS